MPFEEKVTWVSLVVAVVVPVAYFAIMLGRLGDVSAADISYQWPLLIAIGASVVLTIVGSIAGGDRHRHLGRAARQIRLRRHRPQGRAGQARSAVTAT